jgi:hypothetical protein
MRFNLFVATLALQLTGCYLTRQGYRQVGLLMSREPIEKALKKDTVSPRDREKLLFTKDVLAYARSAGLNVVLRCASR